MALSVELEDRSFDFDDLEYCSLYALDLKEEEVVESVLDLDGLEGDNFYDFDLFCKSDLDFDGLEDDSSDDLKDDVASDSDLGGLENVSWDSDLVLDC